MGLMLTKIRQHLDERRIGTVEQELLSELARVPLSLPSGARLAIAVGSRGIADIVRIVAQTVRWARSNGFSPFIVPAMGSHGGATADGQRAVLEAYGVTEATVGAPILSSLEVVELPRGDLTTPVYFDRHALSADATIVINRIKPHTDYHGPLESGLIKMCVIGLGKHAQALEIHRHGVRGLRELILPTARQVLRHANVVLGIAVVENALEQTAILRVIPAADFEREESLLLSQARDRMARLPFDDIDLLIVDEFGKDVSGVGIDTNVIGRMRIRGVPEPESPRIASILLADLTCASHGNALGMGLADVITERVRAKIDARITYENVVTSSFLERGKMPIVARTAAEGVAWALRGAGVSEEQARIVRIRNTRNLGAFYVSAPLLPTVTTLPQIDVTHETRELVDPDGNLPTF